MFRRPYPYVPLSESRLCLLYRVSEVTSGNVSWGFGGLCPPAGQGQSPCRVQGQCPCRIVKAEP